MKGGAIQLKMYFEKLRAIRDLKCSEEFRGKHFSPSNYTDSRGK